MIVGGVGSLKGAVIAALALGILNSYVEYWTSSTLAKAAVFAFVILFLQWRPNGIVSFRTRGLTDVTDTSLVPPGVGAGARARADPAVEGAPPHARCRCCARSRPTRGRAGLAFVAFAVVLLACPSFIGNPTDVRQWAEWLCYAMVAVGLDIAWGYGGMLALGQGLFFGLGAYAMGMHLSLEQVPEGLAALVHEPVQRLHRAAAAVAAVPELLVHGLRRRARARCWWPACSACWCSSAASGARSSPSSPRPRR